MVPETEKKKNSPLVISRNPGLITTLPFGKYKILFLMKTFISYLEKVLFKLKLNRTSIFNNFAQLSDIMINLKMNYTKVFVM